MKIKRMTLSALLGLSLTQCGPQGGNQGSCTPNVIDTGLQLLVAPLTTGSNTYTMQLCAAPTTEGVVFSVYGGPDQPSVTQATISVSGAQRSAHIADAATLGTTFQVTFSGSDNYFAIYKDKYSSGAYQLDSTTYLVQPHRLPGR